MTELACVEIFINKIAAKCPKGQYNISVTLLMKQSLGHQTQHTWAHILPNHTEDPAFARTFWKAYKANNWTFISAAQNS